MQHPINKEAQTLSCIPFFIIGSGRCGTTLLRTILTSGQEISIPPESYVLAKMFKFYKNNNKLKWRNLVDHTVNIMESYPHFDKWEIDLKPLYKRLYNLGESDRTLAKILDEIYCYYSKHKFPNAVRWGDKTPLNTLQIQQIDQIFLKAQYIHLIRDGRDVVSSYLKAGRYKNVEGACRRWNRSIDRAFDLKSKKKDEEFIEVSYERLVTNPLTETQRICGFLGVNFNESMLTNKEIIDQLGDTDLPHHSNLKKPINAGSIGKWKNSLSKEEQNKVNNLLKRNLSKLGYV